MAQIAEKKIGIDDHSIYNSIYNRNCRSAWYCCVCSVLPLFYEVRWKFRSVDCVVSNSTTAICQGSILLDWSYSSVLSERVLQTEEERIRRGKLRRIRSPHRKRINTPPSCYFESDIAINVFV